MGMDKQENGELNGKELRVCKKCLLRDLDEGELFQTVQAYVERLEEDIKTPKEEYGRRLGICKECEDLLGGMCRICGCYVELRAAVHSHYCPAVKRKW